MTVSAAGAFFLIAGLGLVILTGWGQIVQRLVGLRDLSLPVTAAVGLSGLLFLGGILNGMKLVAPGSVDALVVVGLAAAGFFAWREPARYRWRWHQRSQAAPCWRDCWRRRRVQLQRRPPAE